MGSFGHHLSEVRKELKRWRGQGDYPPFVTVASPRPDKANICPIFMFHKVSAKSFEAMLRYLSHNGYQTVTLDEYLSGQEGCYKLTEKHVLLTFDDGRSSQWTIAEPLLKKYNFCGVLFAIPGFIGQGLSHPQISEEMTNVQISELETRDASDEPLMNESEIKAIHERGVMEVESHSMKHERVFSENEIVDFWNPDLAKREKLDYEIPTLLVGEKETLMRDQPWGTPIYKSSPRFLGAPRFLDDVKVRLIATNYVAQNGDENFFRSSNWKAKLINVVQPHLKSSSEEYEAAAQMKVKIKEDLKGSKETLECLLGKEVKHLCLPWGAGSQLLVDLAEEVGFKSISWTSKKEFKDSRGLCHMTRLKNDLIWRLPGKGRWSIAKLFWQRFLKRLTGKMDY